MGKEAFLIRRYSASFSLTADQAKGITGNDMGFTANPAGYTAIGIRTIDLQNSNVGLRYCNVGGQGTSTVYVLVNRSSSAQTGTCSIEILFVRSDLIGS